MQQLLPLPGNAYLLNAAGCGRHTNGQPLRGGSTLLQSHQF
jgi:hypothetical protein